MEKAYDLFMLMFNLSQLHSKERIITLFVNRMNEMFNPITFVFTQKPSRTKTDVFEIKTTEVIYGYLGANWDNGQGRERKNLLINAIQMLAMILENLNLNNQLRHERDSFEKMAHQRMDQLNKTIQNLEKARTASINLIEDLSFEIEKRVEIEKSLRESEEKYRRIAENISDVVWTTDLNLNTTYVSPSVTALTGRTPQQTIAEPIHERFTAKSLHTITKTFAEELHKDKDPNIDKNRSCIIEAELVKPDRSIIWVAMNISFIRDVHGNPIGLQGVTRNITEQKRVQEDLIRSEEKYRLFFEKSPLGILHFDNQGRISDCNRHFVEIIGSSKEVLIGLEMRKLNDKKVVEILNTVLKGKSATYEGKYKSQTAVKNTPVRMLFTPIISPGGLVEGGIGLVEDRSAHMQEEELRKQVEVVKESVKFKQNFLANMSHEIRTPLTGILGMIEIIEQTDLSENQKEYINILKSSGENLREIINQVLDFSKIEAGKVNMNYSTFEFRSIPDDARKLFSNICRENVSLHVELDDNIPAFIKADRNRISQVVNNLISNAVKFTHKGKIVLKARVESFVPSSQKILIRIEVIDTGIGISEVMQQKLFVPFSQIDENDTRVYEGTGLGLSICKELANLHGGEIGLVSKAGKGSTFWFTFMTEISQAHQQTFPPIQGNKIAGFKKLRVLFAEDKEVNQKVVNLLLRSLGHEMTVVSNGREAIELFEPGKFDLILMDIQMPVMDGIMATQQLKKKYLHLPPVVGLSANAFEGDREKYMTMGMDDYLTKPVKLADFNDLIQRLFA